MKTTILLNRLALHPVLAKFHYKKDIPKQPYGVPVLVDFGLWGMSYLLKTSNGLLMKDGSEMPIHEAYLHTGHVIGQHDLCAADGTIHADGWRESYGAAIMGRLEARP